MAHLGALGHGDPALVVAHRLDDVAALAQLGADGGGQAADLGGVQDVHPDVGRSGDRRLHLGAVGGGVVGAAGERPLPPALVDPGTCQAGAEHDQDQDAEGQGLAPPDLLAPTLLGLARLVQLLLLVGPLRRVVVRVVLLLATLPGAHPPPLSRPGPGPWRGGSGAGAAPRGRRGAGRPRGTCRRATARRGRTVAEERRVLRQQGVEVEGALGGDQHDQPHLARGDLGPLLGRGEAVVRVGASVPHGLEDHRCIQPREACLSRCSATSLRTPVTASWRRTGRTPRSPRARVASTPRTISPGASRRATPSRARRSTWVPSSSRGSAGRTRRCASRCRC